MCGNDNIEQKTRTKLIKEAIEYSEEINKRIKESEKEIREADIRHPSV